MSTAPVDYQMFREFGAQPVACEGGLDFLTSKVSINPGSLQDCMNHEVGRESGYKIVDGLLRYSGKSEYVLYRPINASVTETVSTLADFYVGGEYRVTSTSSNTFIGTIKLFDIDEVADTIQYQIIDGNEEDLTGQTGGYSFRLYPDSGNVANYVTVGSISPETYTDISDYITKNVALNQNIAGGAAAIPGTGPVNILFEMDDKIYAGRDIVEQPQAYVYFPNTRTNSIVVFSLTSGALTQIDDEAVSFPPVEGVVDPGFTAFYCPDNGGSNGIYYANLDVDGTFTGTNGLLTNAPDTTVNYVQFSPDGSYLAAAHFTGGTGSFSGNNLSIFTLSGTTLTLLDSINVGTGAGIDFVRFSPDGSQLLVCDIGSDAYLVSWDSGTNTLAEEDSIVGAGGRGVFVGNTRVAIADNSLVTTYNTSGNTFSSALDAVTGDTQVAYGSNNVLYLNTNPSISQYDINAYKVRLDGSLELIDTVADVDYLYFAATSSGEFLVGSNATNATRYGTYTKENGLTIQAEVTYSTSLLQQPFVYSVVSGETKGTRLYTPTDPTDLAKDVEWETVDLGYEVGFDAGQQQPITYYDRQFVEEDFETPENPTDITGSFAASVYNSSAQSVSQPYKDWLEPQNALDDADGGSVARAERGPSTNNASIWTLNTYYKTNTLRITGFPFGEETNRATGVVGCKVDVRWAYNADGGSLSGTQARVISALLRNVGTTTDKASAGVGATTTENSFQTSTFGGATDTWSATEPNIDNFLSSQFGVDLVFETRYTGGTSTNETQMAVLVDWVRVTLYLDNATQKVYFWNTSADVATGEVVDYYLDDGEFSKSDAEGSLYLYNVSSASSIIEDLQIRTQPNGAGLLIANTTGTAEVPLLPSSDDMALEGSMAETIKANFYLDEAREAIYGVTGAGPAFTFDGNYYRKIRAPVPLAQDKPRHIAEHQSHLVLAYKSGSILLSVVGEPTNFSGVEGASEFGFGDRVTGLIGLNGTALGVLCEQSTHSLLGNTIDNFTTQAISKSTGAIEYSVANMGQPIYCDFRGIANISATDQYGDFAWGRLSQFVAEWLQERLQDSNGIKPSLLKVKAAMPVRNKNQYRLFFNDGTILTMTLFGPQQNNPMFTIQNFAYDKDNPDNVSRTYTPTAVLSTVLTGGREINAIGTEDGQVYIMDQGCGIYTSSGVTGYDAHIVFNPFNGGATHLNMRYSEIILHGLTSGGQELYTSGGVNYLKPESTDFEESLVIGDLTDSMTFEQGARRRIPGRVSTHIPEVTDGFSLKIRSTANGNIPYTIQALTFRAQPLSDKNYAPNGF